ncbi:MAG TPA: hypothetical protein VLG47_02545 [Candidatus Saccharimonadales bacterium]|nr:hypothetical protein [Candidatus Saccharimonadales bacterium]
MDRDRFPGQGDRPTHFGAEENGRQTLVVPGRFELSWDVGIVDELDSEAQMKFQLGLVRIRSHMDNEISTDPEEQAAAKAERGFDLHSAVADVFGVAGVSIAYPDRNTRYTNIDGSHFMPEPINPELPMEPQSPLGGIANSLNHPDLR